MRPVGPLAAILAAGVILAGCGGDDESTTASPAPATTAAKSPPSQPETAVSLCGKSASGWKPLRVRTGSQEVQAATLGDGRTGVDAVVSLCGERQVAQYPDILAEARRVQAPILYAGSRHDGYTTFGKKTLQLHEATPARINEILLVPGADHGGDLLAGPGSERMRAAISDFVAKAVDGR